jgi:hypothetical protein
MQKIERLLLFIESSFEEVSYWLPAFATLALCLAAAFL